MMSYIDKYVRQEGHTLALPLSQKRKLHGTSTRTALRWFHAKTITGSQALTGTPIVPTVSLRLHAQRR
jgi:hypothetical protein